MKQVCALDSDHELRKRVAQLEASVNGAASCLNDQQHSRLSLVGEGLLSSFYELAEYLEDHQPQP